MPVITLERLEEWLEAGDTERERARQVALERIRTLDPSLCAWVEVLPQPSTGSGRLAGVPFGVKDIIETEGLGTEYGSPIYKGRRGTMTAAIVRQLRDQGAVLLGKTQTAAFAYRTPAPTRNPRNLEHSPGGSSSGSAAAVAADMIPFAVGSQTLGSVLRPASYCGITGFKPSYGLFSMEGVLPMARSLDTLGFFTHTPADMRLLWEALGQPGGGEAVALGVIEPLPELEPEMRAAVSAAVSLLRHRGLSVQAVPIAPLLEKLAGETRIVMFYEGARFHEERFHRYGERLEDLAGLVREGLRLSGDRYEEACGIIEQGKRELARHYQTTPVILAPAATGPAPRGLASTGDPRVNAPWTALGVPSLSMPLPVEGLPLGLQLTAAEGQDGQVLETAIRIAKQFGNLARRELLQ
jgi:Asp-tRNA(Asn)/Glu-tRNA(Gln) amidotransferase A subunit family amidase